MDPRLRGDDDIEKPPGGFSLQGVFPYNALVIPARGFAAHAAGQPLTPFQFNRRELRPHDILIQILFCGICHSDIHQARNEWGGSTFPSQIVVDEAYALKIAPCRKSFRMWK